MTVFFLTRLEEEQQSNHITLDIRVRSGISLDDINAKLDELQRKFTGANRCLWGAPLFLVSSSIHESLNAAAAAIEPWHKHLELSKLTIEGQGIIQESIDELKVILTITSNPYNRRFEFIEIGKIYFKGRS